MANPKKRGAPLEPADVAPYVGGEAIVVATPFSYESRAIWVGSTGNLTVEFADGSTVQFVGVPTGTLLKVAAVNVTAATASSMIALW